MLWSACSRPDYCISLSYTANEGLINKLSESKTALLVSTVACKNKFASALPILKDLHWLPGGSCIVYKICLITYKVLETSLHVCLSVLLTYNKCNINLQGRFSVIFELGLISHWLWLVYTFSLCSFPLESTRCRYPQCQNNP